MLEAFIIEELKRREHERRERQRPTIDLPPLPEEEPPPQQDKAPSRGVVVLDT